jgi:hypothetical protein
MFNRLDPGRLSFAIESLSRWPATTVSCLSPRECDRMASLADKLVFRPATPVVGAKDAPVHQDFELNYSVPWIIRSGRLPKRLDVLRHWH